ncbi:MAG: AAA family ATPase [Dehalococcoidia bacterium]|jgi:BioD-like phosphotransacetylase family protein
MKSIIVGSMDYNAGKTSVVIGLAKACGQPFGYIKPLGDRLVYRKKRVWDYDAALMTNIFGLTQDPEDMTVGFEHLKLRFKYDEEGVKNRVLQMSAEVGKGKDLLLVEGGKDIEYGISFYLNVLSLALYLDGRLVLVVGGDENYIVDNVIFIKKYLALKDIDFRGVIINKVRNIEDFKTVYIPIMQKAGVDILGVLPYREELTFFSMEYLAQYLLARVVAGEEWLNRRISNIYVGAASVDSVYSDPSFHRENKLMITTGDRADMLLASFEDRCTTAVILTNNTLPAQNILAKAEERKIPVLLVPFGVYEAAKQIEALTPLITSKNTAEIDLMAKMVSEHVNLDALLKD